MIIRNSMKQLIRTPIRTIAMFLLISVSTALFILGLVLFWWNQKDIAAFGNSFTTIGTVEQIPDSVEESALWNNDTDSFMYSTKKKYSQWIKDSVLDFEGANYIITPKKRPYFIAVSQELAENDVKEPSASIMSVAEVIPTETRSSDMIQVHVTNVLSGYSAMQDHDIYISDRFHQYPDIMEAGKKYIVYLNGMRWNEQQSQMNMEDFYREYYMDMMMLDSTQYTIDDEPIGKEAGGFLYDEVTEGFYETKRGKAWRYLAESIDKNASFWAALPVRPVESTEQLMAFYTKKADIKEGKDITKEEYNTGEDVCLISSQFASLMELKVGDKFSLPLSYVVYGSVPSENFSLSGGVEINMSELNAEFEPYQVFDNDEYTVVGIYEMKASEDSAFGLAPNEVIVPYKSVTSDWSNNIVNDAPMTIGTTTFQIPNGTIEQFEKAWKAQGIDGLKITFYDGGYSTFQNAIKDQKMMSYILLFGGGIATIVVLTLFGHLQIIRQKNRIFIERALGMNRQKCRMSILSSMYLLMICGVAVGGIASFIMTDSVMNQTKSTSLYKTTFSIGVSETVTFTSQMSMVQKGMCVGTGCVIVVVCAFVILNLHMNQILKDEPVELMEKEE